MRLVDIDDIRVMKFLSEEDDTSESDGEREYRNGWNDALTAINDIQPSAEPEQRWIPCKTVLPEKGQYVLCQCRAGIMDVLHLTDDNGWYKDSTHIYMHGFVLAWMPLPEPWKGEEDEVV